MGAFIDGFIDGFSLFERQSEKGMLQMSFHCMVFTSASAATGDSVSYIISANGVRAIGADSESRCGGRGCRAMSRKGLVRSTCRAMAGGCKNHDGPEKVHQGILNRTSPAWVSVTRSAPAPPSTVSLPLPVVMVSLPLSPKMTSLPSSPSSESLVKFAP